MGDYITRQHNNDAQRIWKVTDITITESQRGIYNVIFITANDSQYNLTEDFTWHYDMFYADENFNKVPESKVLARVI